MAYRVYQHEREQYLRGGRMQRVPHEIARREQPERRQHRSADEHARHRAHDERQEQRRVERDTSQSKKRAASSRPTKARKRIETRSQMREQRDKRDDAQPFVRGVPVSWGKTATAKNTAATASSAAFRFFGIPYPILFSSSTSPPKKTTGPKIHRFRLASDALR